MGHLNQLWDKYKDKGFVLLAVTDEPRKLVDAFVAKNGAKYPIVIEGSDSARNFGITGFPSTFLIAPNGRIVSAGNGFDDEALLGKVLEKALVPPTLPESLSAAQKLVEKRKFADARAALAKAGAADKQAADAAIAWIDKSADSALADAQELEKTGQVGDAGMSYEEIEADYAGLDAAAKADAALKALLADSAKKKEVDAAKALDKARDKAAGLAPKKQIPLYKSVASNFKGTKAGEKATQIVADLEAKDSKAGK